MRLRRTLQVLEANSAHKRGLVLAWRWRWRRRRRRHPRHQEAARHRHGPRRRREVDPRGQPSTGHRNARRRRQDVRGLAAMDNATGDAEGLRHHRRQAHRSHRCVLAARRAWRWASGRRAGLHEVVRGRRGARRAAQGRQRRRWRHHPMISISPKLPPPGGDGLRVRGRQRSGKVLWSGDRLWRGCLAVHALWGHGTRQGRRGLHVGVALSPGWWARRRRRRRRHQRHGSHAGHLHRTRRAERPKAWRSARKSGEHRRRHGVLRRGRQLPARRRLRGL
mmetsp:Transcript_7456/g.15871  ORF Transcript_7456/g.15871 Transcript_7456/m.15871 type:complete len:278 (+) Transcript_7456:1014-1847(+)